MSWSIGDRGFEMTLSSRVPDIIARNLRPWHDDWLAGHGLGLSSIASWAVHPGGPRILSAFGEAADLPRAALDPSYEVLSRFGNMSSPTVLFHLGAVAVSAACPCPAVAIAFGPGLSIEATCALAGDSIASWASTGPKLPGGIVRRAVQAC